MRRSRIRAAGGVLAAACLLAPPLGRLAAQEVPKLDRHLSRHLAGAVQGHVPVLIELRPPPAPQALRVPGPDEKLPRAERHVLAVQALRANAAAAQRGLLSDLRAAERAGAARDVEPLWIANMVRAEVEPLLVAELARRADVLRIYLDRVVRLDRPLEPGAGEPALAGQVSAALQAVRVDRVWDLGFTGTGMLLANLDSGVQGNHPALVGKWRGLRAPVEQAWFDPFRNSTFPVDDDPTGNGHGTATMGLLVGGDRSIGVAFDAEWIAANIFENDQSFVSTILKGLQWATDPDGDPTTVFDVPDAINASFGLSEVDSVGTPTDRGLCDDVFDAAVDAAGRAGSVVVFSAGNFNIADPGDISSPASSGNAFGVGAVDNNGVIEDFSGRGPSLCEGPDPDRIKPDVVAPGRQVRSLNRRGGEQNFTGTSFAAPIVAGIAALVRQKNPLLSAEQVAEILVDTARDLGAPGPDNTFGSGFVDALAAVNAAPAGGPVLRLTGFSRTSPLTGSKVAPAGVSPSSRFFLVHGENAFDVRLTNPTATAAPAGTVVLVSRSPYVEIVDGEASLPAVPAGGEVELPFRVRLAPDTPQGQDLGFTLTVNAAGGPNVLFTLVAGAPIEGDFATHDENEIRVTLTNFGAIGFWLGVAAVGGRGNELIGEGFHFPQDDPTSYLFHGSFMVGRSPTQVSDDVPYGNLAQSVNDFHALPGVPLETLSPGAVADQEIVGAYDDSYNLENELGVSVLQRSYAFDEREREDFVIVTYDVTNRTSSPLTNVHFGLFVDWDFLNDDGDPRETMDFVAEQRLGVVEGEEGGPTLGIVALNDVPLDEISYRIVRLQDFQAPEGGAEIRESDKFEFLSDGVPVARVNQPQDLAHVIAFGPRTIAPRDSVQAAFAFVGGSSIADLRDAAQRARTTYQIEILGREPPQNVPTALQLAAPFPNPLRPGAGSMRFEFGLPAGELSLFAARPVELRILDLRGRVVRTLIEGELIPGAHEAQWDGLDENGRAVPSGVYAVALESDGERVVRKLVVVR